MNPQPFLRRAILSLLLMLAIGARAQTAGVLREVYSGIPGSAIADLTNSPSFPNNPTTVGVLTMFEAPQNVDESYGQRLTAYVVPPTTGNYIFWISSDDDSRLFLSTSSDSAGKVEIAGVSGWTNPREWTKYSTQQSASIRLVSGQKYYIEALMKEGGGGDNLAVRWQLPNGTIEEPIPQNRLQVYGLTVPKILQQPSSTSVIEGGNATFSVQLERAFGTSYQWQRGTANILGATNSTYSLYGAKLSDNGATFRCAMTNNQGSTISASATLTVMADTTPPTILSVANLGDNTLITVLYSEPVDAVNAINPANYTLNNGATVAAASFGSDYQSVVLKTSPLNQGVTYTLTVNKVQDRAGNPNTIAANTQRSFAINFTPQPISNLSLNREPIGPSTRHTGLVFSEIMFHPTNRLDGKVLEFVELYNSQAFTADLSGYRLSGDIDYTFPANTRLASGGYLVVAPVPADVQGVYGITGVLGGFTNRLSNGSGMLRLRNKFDAILLEAHYSGDAPWPIAADGAGHSIVLARPTYGEGNPEAWEASDMAGGTPGRGENASANPYATVVINEFLAHTDDPEVDYIELYNYSASPVDITGCTLSDHPITNRFVIPNTVIPAKGFAVFTQTTMGFSLGASGETIYFKNPSGTKVLDVVRFKGQENGVSTGRYPDGAPGFYRLQTKTPGTQNGPARVSTVVLNEIMYKPITGSDDEFVELYNRGTNAVNLGGWKLSDAVSYTFPSNAVIAAGGYLVVANKAAHLMTNYSWLNANNTFGDFGGTLPSGGRIALTMPDTVQSTNGTTVVTNTIHITVDEVTYGTGGRWGQWSSEGGSSLELIDPRSNHRLPSNWGDSDETAKSGWTNIEFTGILDNGSVGADALHILLQGPGECLIDNVQVMTSGGVNLVPNPDFETDATGWYFQGTHDQSYWQPSGGYGGSKCLHVIATGRGDTGANHVRVQLSSAATPGDTVTLRAKVRWLKGNPEILLRLHGNWLEAYGNILAARNFGTPGVRNTCAKANSGPAIHDVSHSPVLPSDGQAVVVRAQVDDPDGLSSLVLKYRVDPSTNYTLVSMTYNGAGSYTATIPGQAAASLVAFVIQAADYATPPVTTLFPNDAPTRECLVRFGDPVINTGRVGTYRFWITQKTNDRWTSREHNSNEPLDSTFVYGDYRVVYNVGALYSGSPWHTPGYNGPLGSVCDYVLIFPDDDMLLGATDFVLASLGNLDSDNTAQREQAAFWILGEMGVPTLYRRHINLLVNGLQRGLVYEDAQQPGSDTVNQWFSTDSNGDLHKIEDWFEFDPSGDSQASQTDATLQDFTTSGGAKKLARYRWNWRKRAVKNSANEYSALFSLVDAMNAQRPDPFTSEVNRLVDYEEWTRVMALEHSVGNWDSYGYQRGKNMFTYKPQNGKWTLLPWDIDFVFDNGGNDPTTDMNPATMPCNDAVIQAFLSYPFVQRAWWRSVKELLNGPLQDTALAAMMNDKYQGLAAAGLPVASPAGAITYVQTRRSYLQTLLSTVSASFAVNLKNISTNQNYITVTGTAPIDAKDIGINGAKYPVTWTSTTTWLATIALNGGANTLKFSAYDRLGNVLSNLTSAVTVNYTGTSEQPQGHILINEIMYNAALPNAGFIEIYNTSAINAFDLSNWTLHGADFTFPNGAVIAPKGFLVIAENVAGFEAAYGKSIPLVGTFNGSLKNVGETLQLVKPGATPDQDVVINEVSYDTVAPWPTTANGFGPSLQLIDPTQSNNRVANWAVGTTVTPPNPTPQWQYVTATGTASSSRLYLYLNGPGDVYIDDIKIVAGSTPEVGANYVLNGDFESGLTSWQTTPNTVSSSISSTVLHGGTKSLHLVCAAAGSSSGDSLLQDTVTMVNNAQYTLSFWYLQTTNPGTLTLRLSGSGIVASPNIQMPTGTGGGPTVQLPCTPGAANSVAASLPQLPGLWLNEIQPNNASGIRDNAGDRDPWVELYNSGATNIDLSAYRLSDVSTNLAKWAFPSGSTITPGQFKLVWLDNETAETSGTNLHANFRANGTNGSIFLTKVSGSVTSVIDYLNYGFTDSNRSYGAFPDGTPTKRNTFYYATPGAPNTNAWPIAPVYINEWMASNSRTIVDPDNTTKYPDWFELYNAGPDIVDLSGYYLANSLTNKVQSKIPSGWTIPSHGFLMVWATGDKPKTNDLGLHANFKLSASGETIALFSPTGALLDSVVFGAQTNDISQGRWPDGSTGDYSLMPRPTPGAANVLGMATNHPPTLAAIADQTVYQNSPLIFTVSATDPDADQTLTYSLDVNAPATASINPGSGVFTWTPTQADPPGIYAVTVIVTDNGIAPLTDSKIVNINVVNPPALKIRSEVSLKDGTIKLIWPTQPGRTYRVSYKFNLEDPAWTNLSEVQASALELSITDELLATAHRFYRIEMVTP